MKITRDGVEYELTYQEMCDAFYEQQHIFDMEYIAGGLLDAFDYDDEIIAMQKELKEDKELCNRVAHRYRKFLEDAGNAETEFACFIDAWKYVGKLSGVAL